MQDANKDPVIFPWTLNIFKAKLLPTDSQAADHNRGISWQRGAVKNSEHRTTKTAALQTGTQL
jgi:hypothetical protein